jgi:SulP family sulfate permease
LRQSIFANFVDRLEEADLKPSGKNLTPARLRIEILSGLTVALALVPEAVAFAFVAGVDPLVGLYAAFIVGLITALIGGRPGMISGATGALAVVMVALVANNGVEYLFASVFLMGLIQLFVGFMHWGKFMRLVPHPVMLGFVNGLAIVIFLAQMSQFQVPGTAGEGDGHGMASADGHTVVPDARTHRADHGNHLDLAKDYSAGSRATCRYRHHRDHRARVATGHARCWRSGKH